MSIGSGDQLAYLALSNFYNDFAPTMDRSRVLFKSNDFTNALVNWNLDYEYDQMSGKWISTSSIREEALKTGIIYTLNRVFGSQVPDWYYKIEDSIEMLARRYSALNPNPNTLSNESPNWLDALWRAQFVTTDRAEVQRLLEVSVNSLRTLVGDRLSGTTASMTNETVIRSLNFVSRLLEASSEVRSFDDDMKSARFLQELVEFGFEVAKVKPTSTRNYYDKPIASEWIDTLWSWNGSENLRSASQGLAMFAEGFDSIDRSVKGLEFAGRLVRTADAVDDPVLDAEVLKADFLSNLVNAGGDYVSLGVNSQNISQTESSCFSLVARNDTLNAANALEIELQTALYNAAGNLTGRLQVIIRNDGKMKLSHEADTAWVLSGSSSQLLWDNGTSAPSDDEYPLTYQILRQDGTLENPLPGDTVFTFSSQRPSVTNPVFLYPGDQLLFPEGKDKTFKRIATLNWGEKALEAIRLSPSMAGPQIQGQINEFVDLVKNNGFLASLAFGGFVAAQVAQPIGAILDIGLILLGGFQTGLSFGSFLYKSATSENQTDILQASREFVNTFTNLAGTIAAPAGLLKLEISGGAGLANATKFLDGARRLWREIDSLSRIRGGSLTVSDGLSAIFRVFTDDTTPVGRLLQYGSEGVKSFLGNSIAKLTTNISIQGLQEFADRFKFVTDFATKLDSLPSLRSAFAEYPRNLSGVLDAGLDGIKVLQNRIELLGDSPNIWAKRLSLMDSPKEVTRTLEALNYIMQQRQQLGVGKSRNVAFGSFEVKLSNGTVLSESRDALVSISGVNSPNGTLQNPLVRRLTQLTPDNQYHSEAKILEEIASRIIDAKVPPDANGQYSSIEGTIKLFTERKPCNDCTPLITKYWKSLFPKIEITEVLHGPRYLPGDIQQDINTLENFTNVLSGK